ncbi:hypothetical protein BDV34DRAFT_201672 [Aspergillus parasiticus]|uniref:Uncharacterized protein n=1 Tax=Aspergillus parasiticus TaxID=5067 RepID=A0A5N6DAI7_ASPPA|nr:hypothetical protein BDV34DRAFT_201672 [Aspergillus parasiticus]
MTGLMNARKVYGGDLENRGFFECHVGTCFFPFMTSADSSFHNFLKHITTRGQLRY